eukprot:TRINITY_DN61517_c0_g1_i1.p1 TRINITY_DN61517_c0_g1~~TRINITY_DN61517_c0_g1_i1.p1  ORF type:complete len:833 (+),score=178.52 TRINITY_DN61517_c0_g1_i1:47-2500(+)
MGAAVGRPPGAGVASAFDVLFGRPSAAQPEAQVAQRPLHVVVVGAGIAGLSAAVALHRRGHTVTVLEQASDAVCAPPSFYGDFGAGAPLREALEEIGIWDKARVLLVRPLANSELRCRQLAYCDSQVRDALLLDGSTSTSKDDVGDISRIALRRLLLRTFAAGAGADALVFNCTVESFKVQSSAVSTQKLLVRARRRRQRRLVADGGDDAAQAAGGSTAAQWPEEQVEEVEEEVKETFVCDLLVGADGVTSTVRRQLLKRLARVGDAEARAAVTASKSATAAAAAADAAEAAAAAASGAAAAADAAAAAALAVRKRIGENDNGNGAAAVSATDGCESVGHGGSVGSGSDLTGDGSAGATTGATTVVASAGGSDGAIDSGGAISEVSADAVQETGEEEVAGHADAAAAAAAAAAREAAAASAAAFECLPAIPLWKRCFATAGGATRVCARGRCGDRRQLVAARGLSLARTYVFIDSRGSMLRVSFNRGFILWIGSFWIRDPVQKALLLSEDPPTIRRGVLKYLLQEGWHESIFNSVADSADRWMWATAASSSPRGPDWAMAHILRGKNTAKGATRLIPCDDSSYDSSDWEEDQGSQAQQLPQTQRPQEQSLQPQESPQQRDSQPPSPSAAAPPAPPGEAEESGTEALQTPLLPAPRRRRQPGLLPAELPLPRHVVLIGGAAHGGADSGSGFHAVTDAVEMARHVSYLRDEDVPAALSKFAARAQRRVEERRRTQLRAAAWLSRLAVPVHMLLFVLEPLNLSVVNVLGRVWLMLSKFFSTVGSILSFLWKFLRFVCTIFVLWRLVTLRPNPALQTPGDL